MKLALAQISSTSYPEENLASIELYTKNAAELGAQLIVFPEAAMCRFGAPLYKIAQPLDGPWAQKIVSLSKKFKITIIVGMFTPAHHNKVKNTLLISRPKQELAHYHKIHRYDAFGFTESATVAAGEHAVTFKFNSITFGVATCYDLRFPHLFTILARAGAEIIIVPASWGDGGDKLRQWKLLIQARALDSATYIIACDQAKPFRPGLTNAPLGIGHSMLCSPEGRIIAEADDTPTLLCEDIDISQIGYFREKLGVLSNIKTSRLRYYG